MDEFIPQPMFVIDSVEQVKAFTDPLRVRVLRILAQKAATNQQLADALGEPHAKVLYHVRFLLDVGLIALVDTQIKGGNVEKYYRAIARVFDIRATANADDETNLAIATSLMENVQQDFIASVVAYPDAEAFIHRSAAWMTPEKMAEFNERVRALISEYWVPQDAPDDADAVRTHLTFMMYRDISPP